MTAFIQAVHGVGITQSPPSPTTCRGSTKRRSPTTSLFLPRPGQDSFTRAATPGNSPRGPRHRDVVVALEIRERCVAFEELRARDGSANNVPAVKAAMDAAGLAEGRVRPPMCDLDPATEQEVAAIVAEWEGR